MLIGVDIGGTNIKAGLFSKDFKLLKKTVIKTDAEKGKETVITNIRKAISEVYSYDVTAIGIGCPGLIDTQAGRVITSPNLPLVNTNLKEITGKKFQAKVVVENDANCFALAAAKEHNADNLVVITLGTGFGTGIIINKKLYKGKGFASEFGHATIKFDGLKARSGKNTGDIEEYVSARGITRLAAEYGLKVKEPLELYKLAEQKNPVALRVFQEIGFFLGIALANIANTLDPDAIVIGGKISNAWKFFEAEMLREFRQRTVMEGTKIARIKNSDAGILGATLLARQH